MTTLLIADDDADVRYVLERVFTKEGFQVQVAPDGAAAFRLAGVIGPDAVLTDLDMPGWNGFELVRAIRADPHLRDVPVALLSGSIPYHDARPADAGVCRTLRKPIGNKDLVEVVRKLVDGGRHLHDGVVCSAGY